MEGALHQVQGDLALGAIVEAEKIEVSDEEKEAEYARLAEQYSMDVEQIKAAVPVEDLEKELKTKKAAEVVYSTAKAGKAPAKKAAKKAEESDEGEEKPKKKAAPKKKAEEPAEGEEKPKKKAAPKKKTEPKTEE